MLLFHFLKVKKNIDYQKRIKKIYLMNLNLLKFFGELKFKEKNLSIKLLQDLFISIKLYFGKIFDT
jgi:hypothetical protein